MHARGEDNNSNPRDVHSRIRPTYDESHDSGRASPRDDPRSYGVSWNRNVWDSSKPGISVLGGHKRKPPRDRQTAEFIHIENSGLWDKYEPPLARGNLTFGHLDQSNLLEKSVLDLAHL